MLVVFVSCMLPYIRPVYFRIVSSRSTDLAADMLIRPEDLKEVLFGGHLAAAISCASLEGNREAITEFELACDGLGTSNATSVSSLLAVPCCHCRTGNFVLFLPFDKSISKSRK